MGEFDPIARAGEAIGKTVEQLLADNDRLTAENARLRAKLELTTENVENAARAMQGEYAALWDDLDEDRANFMRALATAAIKALGDE